jgi:hypothetical protein
MISVRAKKKYNKSSPQAAQHHQYNTKVTAMSIPILPEILPVFL